MEQRFEHGREPLPVLHCYSSARMVDRKWPAVTLLVATAAAAALLVGSVLTAAATGRLGWLPAAAVLFSTGYLYLAPTSTLAYERTRDRMLPVMLARLEPGQRDEVDRWLTRPRVRISLLAAGLLPIGLVLAAYVAAPSLFQEVLILGGPATSTTWAHLTWLLLGGAFAGVGVAASLEAIWITLVFTRFPEPWNPLRPATGSNREDLARLAHFAAMRFVLTGGWLLPGVIAIAVGLDGGGLGAVVAIASTVLVMAAALLIVPAGAIHRRSRADKRAHLHSLATRIESLQHRLESDSGEDNQRDYYNLRSLLEIRSQLLDEPASPDSVDLVRQLPRTTVAPLLATAMSLPFV